VLLAEIRLALSAMETDFEVASAFLQDHERAEIRLALSAMETLSETRESVGFIMAEIRLALSAMETNYFRSLYSCRKRRRRSDSR
jgi:hypothetical protein